MPPKNQTSKKTVEKQKAKIVEDKTFGLKNKKGAKQQKYVEQVQKSVYQGNKSNKEIDKSKGTESKKDQKKKEIDELNSLFKPVVELQKIGKGVDPKSVLCVYFKQGQCSKGDKCKFSHDLNIGRRSEKRNIYEIEEEKDDMIDWDQSKLEDVVNKKHGLTNNGLPPTTIICKFFLEAVELNKYGWFWSCPTGDKCHYKHALPKDFVLKRDKKKMEEQKEDQISLEDLIENERAALGDSLTRITWESFIEWKQKKRASKMQQENSEIAVREKAFRQGKQIAISGKELFKFNPDFAKECQDDMEDGDVYTLPQSEQTDDYDGPVHEINIHDYYGDMLINRAMNSNVSSSVKETLKDEVTVIDEDLFQADDLADLEDEIDNLNIDE